PRTAEPRASVPAKPVHAAAGRRRRRHRPRMRTAPGHRRGPAALQELNPRSLREGAIRIVADERSVSRQSPGSLPACPMAHAGGNPVTARESFDFTLKENRAERVQTVNGGARRGRFAKIAEVRATGRAAIRLAAPVLPD